MFARHNPLWEYILITIMNEATVDAQEDMMIRSGFYYITADKFQCEQKVDKYYDLNIKRKKMNPDKAMEEAERMVETQNSCNTIKSSPMYEIDGYSFNTCVCNFIHPELNFFFTLFSEYDQFGTLPFPGALSEQPAYIMDTLALLKSLKQEKEAADRERQERQQNSRRR